MQKFLRTFAIVAAMMLPFAMQAQDSWTVADGTTVHAGVPFDFYNTDESGTSFTAQMLYPATLISDMAGNTLSGITFYHSGTNSKTLSASTWTVKMGESSLSDLSAGLSTETLTTVYAGSLVFTSGVINIEFDSPYTYTSGNLIVEISTVGASGNWISPSGAGCKGEDNVGYTYTTQTSPNHFAFLPKTTFTKAPSCIAATGLAVSAITTESVTLSWTSDATSFDIYDMATHTLVGNSSTNSYTVENLDANTAYTFGVVVDCGGGDYSDTVTVSAHTPCVAIDVDADNPFSEGFEGTTFPPDCWSIAHTAGSSTNTWIRNTSTSSVHTGSASAQLQDQSSGNKNNLVTPVLNIPEANGYQVSFWIYRSTTSYTGKTKEGVKVWVNTTPDTVGGTPLMHIRRSATQGEITEAATGWYQYSAVIPTSGEMYVIFEGISEYGAATYIDDIAVEEAPSCLAVTLPHIAAATSESLTLSWSDAANASATYSVYMLTPSDTTLLQSGVSDTFYVVEDLAANTAYTFGVVADCGGGDLAEMVVVSGRTACGIIASLPWSDNLESVPSGSNPMPFCWSRYNNLTTGNSYYPYNTNSSSYAHSGNYSLYWYYSSYGTYADTAIAILPQLDVMTYPMNGNQLSFWGRMSNSTQSITVYVGTMSDPEDVTTFTTSGTVTVSGATHTRYDVNLSEANATDAYAAIMVLKPTGSASLYIDDVMLHEAPSCAYITGLTVTGATAESISLSWVDEGNTDATYSVYVVTPSDTTLVASNIADTAYTVEDLDANTAYVFGVVANCTGGDAEMVVVNGRTACSAIELPYTETFAAAAGTRDCWTLVSNNTTNAVSSPTSNNYMGFVTYSGHDVMVFNSWSSASDYNQYGYSPLLDASTLTDADSIHVRVVYSTYGTADQLKFGYTTAASTNPTDYTWVGPFSTSGYDNWATLEANLPLDVVQLAVNYTTSSSSYKAYVDSVVVTGYTIPSCPAPTGLAVSNITGEGATLSWNGEAGSYVVYQATATDTTVYDGSVSDNSLELTDLLPNTAYTFGVAANCGSDESARVYVSFTTPCAAVAVPFTETFEAASTTLACWSQESVETTSTWTFGAGTTASGITTAYEGSANARIQIGSYTGSAKLISPVLDLGGAMAMQVKFAHVHSPWGSDIDDLNVLYRTSADGAWTTIASYEDGPSTWTLDSVTLPANTYQVAFEMVSAWGYGLGIDNVVFTAMTEAPCFAVTGLVVDTTAANEVTISWSGDAANYSIYNGTTYVGSTADTFYTVNGLTASTGYTFGVTAVCSATDSADMVTVSARTDCEGGSCNITIASAGYGLMGASIDVMQNGTLVANVLDESADAFSTSVNVCANVPVILVYHQTPYVSYGYDEYVSFTVSDGAGTVLYTCAEGDAVSLTEGQTLLTIANACPTCMPVTDLAVDTVETTSVTISWSGTAASYSVYNGTTYVATVSTNSYTFTGLSAAMNYTFGVVALCDDEDSSAMATIVASTECGIISTFPYTQAFESAPACWATIDADGDGHNWENLQGAMHSASYDNSVGILTPDNWLITPQFQLGAGNSYEVTWNANPQDASYPAEHYGLYVSTNSTIDTATFTMLQEWTLTSAGNTPVVDLSAYSGQTIYLALRHWNCSDQYRIAIDNFELREQAGANQVTITLSQNNPMYGSVAGGGVYTIGDNVTVTATPSAGYQFSKWINSASVTVSTDNPYTFVASTDTALQAVFVSAAATTYDVVVTVNDSTMGTATGSGTYTAGDVVVMTATANPGYHFVNWTQNNTVLSTNNPFSMSATSNTAAYPIIANFEADMVETPTYTVTVNVNDAAMGHVDGVPTAAVDSGAVVNLTAVPESGYHFVSWSNGLTTAAISITVTSDTTVTATFEANPANTYTVAVSVNDAAMGHVDGIPTEPVTAGTVVNLTAVADAGYHFVDWSNGLTTAAISITVTSDTTLVANFEADPVEPTYYTVTVVYDATMGPVDGIPTEPVTSDEEITLTARANEGYVFKGWVIGTDTMSTESTYIFNATADVTIEAVFAAKTGIADVDMANVKVYSVNDVIYVNGAEGHQVYLFDVNGRVLNHNAKAGERVEFRVANTGVYLVKVGNAAAKRVVVAR